MRKIPKAFLAAAFCAAMPSRIVLAQAPPPVILQIDVENLVRYVEDVSDPLKFGTLPGPVPAASAKNLTAQLQLGDIVAVNGQPAKGNYIFYARGIGLVAGDSGAGYLDATRTAIKIQHLEILKEDGSPIGTVMTTGMTGGTAPPGSPLSVTQGNHAVIGGTGAFLGVRGQMGETASSVATRVASITEDPANRRKLGGGESRLVLRLFPNAVPQIVTAFGGPAISHSRDFSMVTTSNPAVAGETLSLIATGLGPTVPGVDPGQPFPSNPLANVNSPIQVTVNGKPAQVLGAVGYPGEIDAYQVNFQIPTDTPSGPASVQVTAAWIPGPPVAIPIQ